MNMKSFYSRMISYSVTKDMDFYTKNDILYQIITSGTRLTNRIDCDLYKRFLYHGDDNTDDQFDSAVGYFRHDEAKELKSIASKHMMDSYIQLNINSTFGISLLEFVNLPIEDLSLILTRASELAELKSGEMDNITKELKEKGLL